MSKQRMIFFISAILGLMIFTASVYAQFTFSGDVQLDSALSSLNASAKMDFEGFKAEINLSYNISAAKVDYLSATVKMEPADIYMTAQLATISKVSVDKVVEVYKVNKGKGWGVIAKELGIKPGSPEFKALKNKALNHTAKIKNKKKDKKK